MSFVLRAYSLTGGVWVGEFETEAAAHAKAAELDDSEDWAPVDAPASEETSKTA